MIMIVLIFTVLPRLKMEIMRNMWNFSLVSRVQYCVLMGETLDSTRFKFHSTVQKFHTVINKTVNLCILNVQSTCEKTVIGWH